MCMWNEEPSRESPSGRQITDIQPGARSRSSSTRSERGPWRYPRADKSPSLPNDADSKPGSDWRAIGATLRGGFGQGSSIGTFDPCITSRDPELTTLPLD